MTLGVLGSVAVPPPQRSSPSVSIVENHMLWLRNVGIWSLESRTRNMLYYVVTRERATGVPLHALAQMPLDLLQIPGHAET